MNLETIPRQFIHERTPRKDPLAEVKKELHLPISNVTQVEFVGALITDETYSKSLEVSRILCT